MTTVSSRYARKRFTSPTLAVSVATLMGLAQLSSRSSAQETSYQALVSPVLKSSETVIGEPLRYPEGSAQVTAAIVTVPPGGETGWHTHPVPLFGYILDGELVVDYGPHGTRTYRKGDGLLEAMGGAHNGRNIGTVPVRILAVYMGVQGTANAEATPPAAPVDPH